MPMLPWRDPPLTEQEAIDLVMLTLLDDNEGPSWVVGGSLQIWCASSFAHSLRNYAREQRLPWYVASMLPIAYIDRPFLNRHILLTPEHANDAYRWAEEVLRGAEEAQRSAEGEADRLRRELERYRGGN